MGKINRHSAFPSSQYVRRSAFRCVPVFGQARGGFTGLCLPGVKILSHGGEFSLTGIGQLANWTECVRHSPTISVRKRPSSPGRVALGLGWWSGQRSARKTLMLLLRESNPACGGVPGS
jgi:hypothetical protein